MSSSSSANPLNAVAGRKVRRNIAEGIRRGLDEQNVEDSNVWENDDLVHSVRYCCSHRIQAVQFQFRFPISTTARNKTIS